MCYDVALCIALSKKFNKYLRGTIVLVKKVIYDFDVSVCLDVVDVICGFSFKFKRTFGLMVN